MNTSDMFRKVAVITATAAVALSSVAAIAAEWSSTTVSYTYGNKYREPGGNSNNVSKNILSLFTIAGYKYGVQLANVDFLMSDSNDPAAPAAPPGNAGAIAGAKGAQEVYAIYRNMLSLGKVTGSNWGFGPVKDTSIMFGLDLNSKNDSFAPRVRKLSVGPSFYIPAFGGDINLYLAAKKEWNHCGINGFAGSCVTLGRQDVVFDTQGVIGGNWNLPIGASNFVFKGRFEVNGKKGKDGFNAETATESFLEPFVSYKVTKDFTAGIGYQYWKNKFGSNGSIGSKTSTAQIKLEYTW